MFNKKIDILAIGDTVVDAFIRLKEAHVNCKVNSEECELCMRFADKIPYESVTVVNAVGNSPNAAVSASRLGLNSALMSDVGGDQYGKDCLTSLKKDKVDTKYITMHKSMVTNYHYVLWYDVDRTILVKHQDYPRKFPNLPIEPKWLYLSSLGANSAEYHEEIATYLSKHPNVKLAFQPGTFQMKLGTEKLKTIYQHSDVFFCNVEESQRILGTEESDKKTLMAKLRALGPKIVVMTDGPNGAYTYDGKDYYFMPLYPDGKHAFERTGAGDAYASTFTSALALDKSVEEALMWAPINAAFCVQKIGAQEGLLTREALLQYLAKAPADYKPSKI